MIVLCGAVGAYAGDLPNHRQGYITSIDGPQAFTVDGQLVRCDDKTRLGLVEPDKTTHTPMTAVELTLGEHVEIEGHRAGGEYIADDVLVARPPGKDQDIHGYALTMEASTLQASGDGWRGRALIDGRWMGIDPKTVLEFMSLPPGTIPVNVWVTYTGKRLADGGFVLTKATLAPNSFNEDERVFIAALADRITPPDLAKHEAGRIKFPLGHIKLEPDEPGMQRMARVAAKLVPAFQKAMPPGTPGKIGFRFFVWDKNSANVGFSFGDGTIVLSKKTLANIENDDVLAGLLAFQMADILLKQDFRAAARRKMQGEIMVATTILAFVPGLSVAALAVSSAAAGAGIYEGIAYMTPEMLIFGQDCRVGMRLMEDAGLDPKKMPLAFIAAAFPAKKMDAAGDSVPIGYRVVMQQLRENYGRLPLLIGPS